MACFGKLYKRLSGFFIIALVAPVLFAQSFHFRTYSTEQGLNGRFVYTINEDNQGYLWIGTGSGICRFDGTIFRTDVIPDSLNESLFLSSYKDSTGNLWFGSNDGLVLQYNGVDTRVFNVREFTSGPINGFVENADGSLIAATQDNGLLKIQQNDKDEVVSLPIDQNLIFSFIRTREGKLLIGTNQGLYLYSSPQGNQPPQLIRRIEEIPETTIRVLYAGKEGVIFAGTSDHGIFTINTTTGAYLFKVTPMTSGSEINRINSQSFFQDDQQHLWVTTSRSGLIKIINPLKKDQEELHFEVYNHENGLETNSTKAVFQDFEGNIWVGTSGKGLSMLMDEAFSFLTFNASEPGNSIYSITADENHYYFGGDYGVLVMNKTDRKPVRLIGTKEGLPIDRITSLFFDHAGVLWIGLEMNGLYKLKAGATKVQPFFVSDNDMERSIQFITGYDSKLWVATKNGIFLFNSKAQTEKHFSTNTGLPYNNISHLFLDDLFNLWFSTTTNELYIITPDLELKNPDYPFFPRSVELRGILMDSNKDIWAATYGDGVLHFTKDSVYIINTGSGLKSDYCYSIQTGPEEKIWIGHRQGFSIISEKEKLIRVVGKEKGIKGDANPSSGFLDKNGKLVLGTSDGVIFYNPAKAKSKLVPPKIILSLLRMNNKVIPLSEKIILPFARYEMKVDFTGLSFSDPEKVNYRYKLENYDDEWSPPGSLGQATYKRLEDGTYAFHVMAYNADYTASVEPASFILIIRKPVWKAWWFIGIMTLLLVALIVIIIKIRERNHKKLEAYLQTELTARTKEVVEQKDEIELKNKEITDSINYAQRIQASVLPPTRKLKKVFPESFVFYQPRDIVSGDFYWWDRVDDDHFLIVCADSTGHGVPGAFMSMIGSTLIKDIVSRNRNIKPSGLLVELDKEITQSLNQNVEVNTSNDGMDIIVCEFNTKNNHMIFASAMRPVIMYHKGEQYYIRGNRSSIGGEMFEDKVFEDQEYHLVKGDVVYLFSDGYPDQFGGPNGKKLKMIRLKNLLEDIHERSMSDQYQHIKQNFEIWRNGIEQVDDVLFMGIQI